MVKKVVAALLSLCVIPFACLANNNLLIGSANFDTAKSTFEKYDDAGNRLLTGNLSVSRSSHTATLSSGVS